MLRNYLKTAYRNILKNKVYASLNIAGLSIGITCCVFIFLYVYHELNYDKFHKQDDRIFRVVRAMEDQNGEHLIGVTSPPYAPALENDFPGIVAEATRFSPNQGLVTYEENAFVEENFCLADENFFKVFSFPLAQGDPKTVLAGKNSVVMTRKMAKKYFGDEDPIGKVIEFDRQYQFTVTGILDDLPGNSHITFDFIATIRVLEELSFFEDWWSNGLHTYVLLEENVKPETLEAQLPNFIDKYMGDEIREKGIQIKPRIQALQDIYFQSNMIFDREVKHGNLPFVYIFAMVALFILAIACINFMNMATAQSAKRSLEVGVRKALGAIRGNLVLQFITESVGLALIAMLTAIVLVSTLQPYFNQLVEMPLEWPFGIGFSIVLFLGIVLVVGLLAGSYPALILSAFRPVAALKGKGKSGSHAVWLRKGLVVFQFFISIILIIATLVVGQQTEYVRNKKLGYDKDHVMLVPVNNDEIAINRETFKEQLRQKANIVNVSGMSGEPGGFHDRYAFEIEDHEDEVVDLRTVFTDHDYVKTLGLKIVAGRDFSRDFSTDEKEAMIINEAAARYLGWDLEEALGKEILNKFRDSIPRRIVGVIEDFHFASLHNTIDPMAIAISNDQRVIAVKMAPGNVQDAVAEVEDTWLQASEKYPFAYFFLDQEYDKLYKAEQKQGTLFRLFAALAIFIACLGLFGLVTFTAEQRTKEIGIRKVLGASVPGLIHLVSKDFTKLVLLALLVAVPVAYWAMNQWLSGFAYRVHISAGIFILAGLIALAIAWITVSFQSIKAALANPIESLRNE